MQANQIVETLKTQKGRHVPAMWQRSLKTLKGVIQCVTKITSAYVRAGIDYENLAVVKDGIESGERCEVASLPWGKWEVFPFIISHTPKGAQSPVEYVRLYPASFANLKPTVEYFIEGIPATSDEAKTLCLASEFRDDEREVLCFTIRADNILAIG